LWICCGLVVQLVVQQIHNKSNKWSLTLSTHADRHVVDISVTVCLFFCLFFCPQDILVTSAQGLARQGPKSENFRNAYLVDHSRDRAEILQDVRSTWVGHFPFW